MRRGTRSGVRSCLPVYGRNQDLGEDWGWRYLAQLGQYGLEIFNDVVELLQWNETLGLPLMDA
ncbi:hypothetical protein HJFPF1_09643 [Paramyrothecium foliicola]|nr:hypothetical protein HJFPF1_09643 [Paramyrothecium foliicola]